MNSPKIFKYTWEMYNEDATSIARVAKSGGYDMLIGIASGGLPFLTTVHNITKIPYEIVKCSSYDGGIKKFLNMEFSIPFIGGKKILILDDVSDTGETLHRVVERCKEMGTKDIVIGTATLCVKPHTTFWPTWYSRIIDNSYWIVFPWE